MTARITDFAEFQAQKMGSQSGVVQAWSDDRVKTRYDLLRIIEERGIASVGDQNNEFFRTIFPDGYDPLAHPEDNAGVIYAECVRRGVFTP